MADVARRSRLHPWALALAALVCSPLPAEPPPEGIAAGPWILAPSFTSSYEVDDNVLYRSRADIRGTPDDRVTKYGGKLRASLPFRNSLLEVDYRATNESYRDLDFSRDVTQIGSFDLELNFKSGDTLSLRDVFRKDFARADEETAQSEVFRGEPYDLNRWEIELARTDVERQGYVVRIRRQDFNYVGKRDIGFFDYRGFHNSFEYRQPMPERRGLAVRYETRRFNHYRPDGPVGDPFRKEKADSLLVGLRGVVGVNHPYSVHLGYGEFSYEGERPSEFGGLVGVAAWRLQLGGRTHLDLDATRQPLPSNSQTYYINNAVRANLEREWLHFEGGAEIGLTKNNYNARVGNCTGDRRDFTHDVEAYWDWLAHERLRFRASAFHEKRRSNCVGSDYEASGFETSVSLGWF